jgi:hypothetical protein
MAVLSAKWVGIPLVDFVDRCGASFHHILQGIEFSSNQHLLKNLVDAAVCAARFAPIGDFVTTRISRPEGIPHLASK